MANDIIFLHKRINKTGSDWICASDYIEHANHRSKGATTRKNNGLWTYSKVSFASEVFTQICYNDNAVGTKNAYTTKEVHFPDQNRTRKYLMLKDKNFRIDNFDIIKEEPIKSKSVRYIHADGDVYETEIVPCDNYDRVIASSNAALLVVGGSVKITDCLYMMYKNEMKEVRLSFNEGKIYQNGASVSNVIYQDTNGTIWSMNISGSRYRISPVNSPSYNNSVTAVKYMGGLSKTDTQKTCLAMIVPVRK